MLMACMHETYSNPNLETRNRKIAQIKKPNSNNLACPEHKQNYKTNLRKHA